MKDREINYAVYDYIKEYHPSYHKHHEGGGRVLFINQEGLGEVEYHLNRHTIRVVNSNAEEESYQIVENVSNLLRNLI